ncbi:MAG: hypothetical protein IV100_14115 [Myxococcales bacterium]|nr:hypothetical protein [Myxococcales bacterium]
MSRKTGFPRLVRTRCRYCHARFWGDPARCPACGFELGGIGETAEGRQQATSERIRLLVVGGAGLLVIVGLWGRPFPEDDPLRAAIQRGRRLATEGMAQVLAGDHAAGLDTATRALEEDDTSPEAHALRSVANLGLGRYDAAITDARLAERYLDRHRGEHTVDAARHDLPALLGRVRCVGGVAVARSLAPAHGRELVERLRTLAKTSCAEIPTLIKLGDTEVTFVLEGAIEQCPTHFQCVE